MEPLDPAKNEESGGFSKRRISSILKAPRKSMRFPDPEQQENVVECAKPVEKRNSRRVSFAPANDVLLFSKDVKNASPARSPLQELMTTTAAAATTTQNRVQVAVTEDGIQQITGMETLLNAPLHVSQQRDKVNFNTGNDFGEKTVMFSTDDAFMDMTHSHTLNIAHDEELLGDISLQNYEVFPTNREKTTMFTADHGSKDMTFRNLTSGSLSLTNSMALSAEKTSISSSVPSMDPEFENFLASLSKRSSVNPVNTRMTCPAGASSEETNSSLAQMKTQRADVDKENLVPASVSAVMEKSLNTSRKIGEPSHGSALCPKDDVSMDMTEAHTGHMQAFTGEEMYPHLDKRLSQTAEKTKKQQSSKTQSSFNPKDMTSLKNPSLYASHQRHKADLETKDECRDKTIMFTAGDEVMDMTRSHTVNIASGLLAPSNQNHTHGKTDNALSLEKRKRETCGLPGSSENGLDQGFKNFLASLSKTSAPSGNPVTARVEPPSAGSSKETFNTNNDVSMDMTEAQTGRIVGLTGSDDPFQLGFPTQDMKRAETTSGQKNSEAQGSSNRTGMETSLKTKVQRHQVNFDAEDDCREKTVRFSADDACMDVTRSHTVNIATHFNPQSRQNVDFLPACGEKTVRFSADDAAMDVTRSHTVNIATHYDPKSRQNVDFLPASGEKTVRFTADDGSMDLTLSHTVKITSGSVSLPTSRSMDLGAEKTNISSSVPSMDPEFENFLASLSKRPSINPVNTRMTPPPGVSSEETNSSLAQMKTRRADVDKENLVPASVSAVMEKSLNTSRKIGEPSYGSALYPKDDVSMDMTGAHTGCIQAFTDEEMYPNHDTTVSQTAEKTKQHQSNKTRASFNPKDETSLKNPSLKASHQTHKNKFDAEDDCREKTVRFTADDACMDVTRSHTVNIATHFEPQSRQNVDFLPVCGEKTVRFTADDAAMDVTRSHTVNIATHFDPQSQKNVDFLPACGEKTVRFSADDAAMDVTRSHTVNIATHFDPQSQKNVDFLPACGEKTVRFTADDAAMDVTRSHTVNIATHFDSQSQKNVDLLPACGEKTVRFSADDAAMDVTRSHTVNIATHFDPQSQKNVDFLPACGEKTVRFTADDAAMDVTRSHTVNIATHFDSQSQKNVDLLPACGEKTVRFSADDAAMDVTRSHTVNIATDIDPQSHQNADSLPTCGEKTQRFTADDAVMDLTQSHTVNIATDSVSNSVLPHQESHILSKHENMDFPSSVKKRESETCRPRRNRSSSALTLDPGFKNSLSMMSGPWANPVITKAAPAAPSPQETADTNGLLDQLKPQKPDVDTEEEASGFVSAVIQTPVNKTVADCPEDDVSMDMTEAQTGHIMEQTCTDEPPQCLSSTQDLYPSSEHLNKTEMTSQQSNGALESSNPDGVEITNRPDSLDSDDTDNRKEPESRDQTCSPSAVDHDVDAEPSQNSRQRSLANLRSKLRRLSHMINAAPDTIDMDSCTATSPQLEHDMDKNSEEKTKSLPAVEPELEMAVVNTEENTQAQCLMEGQQPSTTTTPHNLKTKQLMSRLSVGGFKAKLPRRSKPDDPKKVNAMGEQTRTIDVTNQLSNFDGDVSDIFDEELGSCEDMSEMLDTKSLQKAAEKVNPCQDFYMDGPLGDDVFEQDFIPAVQAKKRPLPADEYNVEDEKRMKASTETITNFEMGLQSDVVECDSNISTAPYMMTQTTDYSNSSHTASTRCEATFESTFKQSLFESQLEDYASDMQRKFDDGTVTVLEFFKLFNIDFVIHTPRQSVLPGRLLSDTDRTPMDVLKDRHINRPKQMVYETNVLNLTEKVEGLKERMQDLNKPLQIINRALWEEMSNSSEKELKSFGAKLKERNALFRKMSKAQSHEMKGELYSDLVQANLEEQQRFRGTIEEADGMIKSLDDCIHELETELAAVEEKGSEDTLSLKSRQEEMQRATEALADSDRQISELEMQKKQNSNKLDRLKAETRNLESCVAVLHMVNEWKFGEKSDNCTTYTFLHETFHLELVFEKLNGNDADNQSERKISHITFKLQLDDEKSQGHACLVHKLLCQYIDGEAAWVEKYPTSRHVPKLLHDVGLVVSRCRLLGEELRLLKMWGGLRLDILNISCVDTQVHIVFSSLKNCSKFEVIFSVSLTNHVCVLQVQSFKNIIGSTTIQQIEEIVALFSPAKNLLTKIVKKIHENLLC